VHKMVNPSQVQGAAASVQLEMDLVVGLARRSVKAVLQLHQHCQHQEFRQAYRAERKELQELQEEDVGLGVILEQDEVLDCRVQLASLQAHYGDFTDVAEQKGNVVQEVGRLEVHQPRHEAQLIEEVTAEDLPEPIGPGDEALMDVEEDGEGEGEGKDEGLAVVVNEHSEGDSEEQCVGDDHYDDYILSVMPIG
jgi:hypothetical protein